MKTQTLYIIIAVVLTLLLIAFVMAFRVEPTCSDDVVQDCLALDMAIEIDQEGHCYCEPRYEEPQ